MEVIIFEHLGITTEKGIYQRWIHFEQVLKGPDLIQIRNDVISCKDIERYESGEQWGIEF